MKNRSVRIFLSSTFRDYGEERDLLVRQVFPALRAKLKDRLVELVDVDLRWGITVEQAEKGEVLPICLAEIDRARPYFVGMLGDRYGWIPPKDAYAKDLIERQPWLEEHRGGKSVTELEILHGVLNNPEMAGRAFFYFRSSAYSKQKGGAYLPESLQDHLRQKQLKSEIIQHEFPVIRYRDPESFAKRLEKDLWHILDKEFPLEEIPDEFTRAGVKHEAYASPRRRLYLGGDQYIQALNTAIEKQQTRILIEGASGGGKSALLANWLEAYRERNPEQLVFEYYLGASTDSADPMVLVSRLIETIKRATGSSEEVPQDSQKLFESLPQWLSIASSYAAKKKTQWVIAIDSLNSLSSLKDLRWFPEFLPQHLSLIISTLPGDVKNSLIKKVNTSKNERWKILLVKPLTTKQRKDLLVTYLAKFNKTLGPDLLHQALAHPLANNPLFIRTLAEELRLFGVHEELQNRLNHYLSSKTIDDLFERVLKRVEQDSQPQTVQKSMQLIWASRVGLSEKEILELLKVPPVEWATIRNALDECLLESNGKISFAHDYMRIAVNDLYLKTQASEKLIHIELAKYFQKQAPDARRIEEEPFQWTKAEEWNALKTCLLNHEIFSLLIGKSSIELSQYWLVLERETKEKLEDQYFKAWQRWKKQLDAKDLIKKSLELAEFIRMSSRYLTSLKILQPLITLCEDVFGKTHEKTQAILSLMGTNYTALAKYDQSLKYLLKVLDMRTKKYGLNHIKTADSINFVSVNYYYAGKFTEANQLAKKVFAIRKRLRLSGEPISEVVNNLANLANELGEFDVAEKYHFQALEIRKKFFGENSWQVGSSFNNLGALMEKEGRFDEAIQYYKKSLILYEEALGKGADYIKTLSNLGLVLSYHDLESKEGNSLQKEALLLAEKVFGDQHPEVARILSNLAFSEEELEVKKELLVRALEIFRKTVGSHQLTVGCLNMIGGVYDDLDELDLAENYLKEAVEMTKKISLSNSKIGADAVYCLGNFYYRNDLQDNGIGLFLDAIDIYKKLNGPMYLFLLNPLTDLAKQYFYNEDYVNAERYYRWALKINEFHYGKEHINTALSLNNVGAILTKLGKNKAAEPYYLRALSIREKNLDPLDSDIGISVFNLGTLYLEINRYELAEKYFERAIAIFKESAPEYLDMANERLQKLYDHWKKV